MIKITVKELSEMYNLKIGVMRGIAGRSTLAKFMLSSTVWSRVEFQDCPELHKVLKDEVKLKMTNKTAVASMNKEKH